MATFTTKITTSANETYEAWRERDHDDMVLAVALAIWLGEKYGGTVRPPDPELVRESRGLVDRLPPDVFAASQQPGPWD